MRQNLLEEAHSSLVSRHGGYLKTLKQSFASFFWPKMKRDVKNVSAVVFILLADKLSSSCSCWPFATSYIASSCLGRQIHLGLTKSNLFDTILVGG